MWLSGGAFVACAFMAARYGDVRFWAGAFGASVFSVLFQLLGFRMERARDRSPRT